MPNVVGLFDSRSEAHSTVQQLVNSGFDREDISLVSQDMINSQSTVKLIQESVGRISRYRRMIRAELSRARASVPLSVELVDYWRELPGLLFPLSDRSSQPDRLQLR